MFTFLKNELTYTETILVFSGLLLFGSTAYIASGGDLAIHVLAKAFYITGAALFILKS